MATRVAREWEPQILYSHHQSSPFPTRIWIPPFAEPISPHVHPLMWRTVKLIGMSMAQALEERGQKGATHMGTGFDNWYPGFMDHANNFHNVASFLTETGLYRNATPGFYTIQDFPPRTRELRPQSLHSSPWEGGWWRLRDAGGLRDRYDVIIVADMGAGRIVNGFTRGSVPPRYEGGIGAHGVRELDAFVRGGGTLVTLNNASMFAIEELHLPVRNVVSELEPADSRATPQRWK